MEPTKLKCNNCGWEGTIEELVPGYVSNPMKPGEITEEAVCPTCGNQNFEEVNYGS